MHLEKPNLSISVQVFSAAVWVTVKAYERRYRCSDFFLGPILGILALQMNQRMEGDKKKGEDYRDFHIKSECG